MNKDTKEAIVAGIYLVVIIAVVGGLMWLFYDKLGCIDGRPLSETPNICFMLK